MQTLIILKAVELKWTYFTEYCDCFITIRLTLGFNFSEHLLKDNCALGNPTVLLRNGIIFRDYLYNTVPSVFVRTRLQLY